MSARLKFRLSAPVMAFSCLPLLVGVFVAWDVHHSHRAALGVMVINVRSVRAAEELAINIRDLCAQLDRFLLTQDAAHLKEIPGLRGEIDFWLSEARRTALTPREFELVGMISVGCERLFDGISLLEELPRDQRPVATRELMVQARDILRPSQEYLDINEKDIEARSEQSQRTAERLVIGLLLLGVCGPIAGLLAGYGIARAVSRSVVRLSIPVMDTAGALSQVVGPVTLSAAPGLEELEQTLHQVAEQAGVVVERLRQSEREALRAEQLAALGQMAAGFAHEVRNPLMSMKLLVQSSARRRAGLAGRGLVVLEEEIGRLEGLTSTFLDFARPPTPQKQAFDARVVVEETVELVANRAGQRDVRLACRLPTEPVWVEADAGQVRQVVLNLLLNALDAVGDGGEVCARLADLDEPGGERWVHLSVEDTGPGLPAELGQDIFAPFVSTKPTGVGLGLSVCKRVAEAHGGLLAASDRRGGGAAFTFRLPGVAALTSTDGNKEKEF